MLHPMIFEITGSRCEDLEDRHLFGRIEAIRSAARGEANRSADVCLFKPLRNIAGLQAVDHLFDITFHEAIQAIDC